MSKFKLLIAESNFEEQQKLRQWCEAWDEFEVKTTACGQEAMEVALQLKPNVVICNFVLKHTDSITLCEKLKEVESETKVVILSSAFSDTSIKRMVDSGVDYYMLRPFEPESLYKQCLYMMGDESQTTAAIVLQSYPPIASKKLDGQIGTLLLEIGIPAHIKGYKYLRDAIKLAMETPTIVNSITKELYPAIAGSYIKTGSTSSKVERAIRHAIEVCFARGKIEKINDAFGVEAFNKKDKPTNGEFISAIADKFLSRVMVEREG